MIDQSVQNEEVLDYIPTNHLDPELDAFLENFINDYIDKILSQVETLPSPTEEERLPLDYMGVPKHLEAKEAWINAGCRPLPDLFYKTLVEFRDIEMKLLVNSKKHEFLFSLIKEIEHENETELFPHQQNSIDLMESMMDTWRQEGIDGTWEGAPTDDEDDHTEE